ncbi:MAG TPA: hypothetical protein PKD90_01825 [Phnomibacter sp.]|nr:hypothetical protein [Phnomibacter sp.]
MFRSTMLSIALLALLTACKKNKTEEGTSATNFLPNKAGSTWTYQVKEGTTTTNYTLTATNRDSTVNANSYRVFTRSTGGPNEYYRVSGTDYFQFAVFEGLGQPLELLYLKAGLNQGATWEETKNLTLSGVPLNVRFAYTVAEKGINYTVAGKVYNKVTRINVQLSAPGVPIASQDINYYYADEVGRIYSKILLVVPLASINTNIENSLINYTLVP